MPNQRIEPGASVGAPSPGSVFNPFSEGGIFDGHTIGDSVYTFFHPNEVQSGQGRALTQSEVEALGKSTPAYVPLDNFKFSLPSLPDITISTSTKVAAGLVAIAIIVLVLKR